MNEIPQEIQRYIDFMNRADLRQSKVLTKDRVDENAEKWVQTLNTFMVYPDILADIMTPANSSFSMFFAQRIVLREMSRHRQSYHTYTRAFSKSFLAAFERYKTTMLLPRHKAFIVSSTKEQATSIAKEKIIQDLWVKFPLLKNEMVKLGQSNPYVVGKDYIEFRFTHGGILDVVGGHPRGLRRNSMVCEEIIEVDATTLNEEVIPLVNAPRTLPNGKVNPKEPNGSKIFVTTAGYMQTFAYSKLMETLCYSVLDPDKYCISGGSYIIPVMHGRLEEQVIRELLASNAYDRDSFDREYCSKWSGAVQGAVFNYRTMQSLRKINKCELKASTAVNEGNYFYAICADMAKDGSAKTAVEIYKVIPKEYMFSYRCVNLFSIENSDYEQVSNILKQTILKYNAKLLVYDANGIKRPVPICFTSYNWGTIVVLTVKPKHYIIKSKII